MAVVLFYLRKLETGFESFTVRAHTDAVFLLFANSAQKKKKIEKNLKNLQI